VVRVQLAKVGGPNVIRVGLRVKVRKRSERHSLKLPCTHYVKLEGGRYENKLEKFSAKGPRIRRENRKKSC